jgi:hypothetical protein
MLIVNGNTSFAPEVYDASLCCSVSDTQLSLDVSSSVALSSALVGQFAFEELSHLREH